MNLILAFLLQTIMTVNPVIEGRLLDMSCGTLGGFPLKVVHESKCLASDVGPDFYVITDDSKVLKINDKRMIDTARKWRPLLGKGEVHITIKDNKIWRQP